jgi:hypothetical protein
MLKMAFGDNAMDRTQTSEWCSQFKRKETLIKGSEHSDCHSTGSIDENTVKVHKIINKDRQSTILEIAGKLGMEHGSEY